jgi:predicted nucleotidyltransferase
VDLRDPIGALIPGVRGKLLTALICAGRELSTSDAARVADVSNPQASRVLAQLVEMGIVERRDVPPAVLYRPVLGNFVVELLVRLCDIRGAVLDEATRSAAHIVPRPLKLAIFGSVARGTSDEQSDIDVLVIRPTNADHDDGWTESLWAWSSALEAFSGSEVNVVEISEVESLERDQLPDRFWNEVHGDMIVLLDLKVIVSA